MKQPPNAWGAAEVAALSARRQRLLVLDVGAAYGLVSDVQQAGCLGLWLEIYCWSDGCWCTRPTGSTEDEAFDAWITVAFLRSGCPCSLALLSVSGPKGAGS
jgi:hypothetical protein